MTSIIIFADTIRSPELRHEIPAEIMDPFLYAEVNGHRYAVVSQLEVQTVSKAAPNIELISPEQLGWDELVERHPDWEDAEQELVVRACRRMGITEAVVPSTFPLELANRLRHRRLRDVLGSCGTGHAPAIDHGEEQAEAAQIHKGSIWISKDLRLGLLSTSGGR